MSGLPFYPRHVLGRLHEALQDSPVVLIHGPRQCGKTTLAQLLCSPEHLKGQGWTTSWQSDGPEYTYITFDPALSGQPRPRQWYG
ncbi:MAG: hypothetical protein F4Y75_06555 [Acidimicrobiia bacterium]|nr:hypothetical protein [Acidimicrobiia bacterium]MYD04240.1 hypothetical protein [Acidimicrobiia bacterium]MYF26395.1 hypothetical protein [Acidimicrobiia bacterium]